MASETQGRLESLRSVWRYDPVVCERLENDMRAFEDYRQKRTHHVALSRADRDEYDGAAVKAADRVRTVAHNEAIRAAADINRLCALCGMDPIAPVCPDGIDPQASKPHRNAVAHYVADVLGLDDEQRRAMDLR